MLFFINNVFFSYPLHFLEIETYSGYNLLICVGLVIIHYCNTHYRNIILSLVINCRSICQIVVNYFVYEVLIIVESSFNFYFSLSPHIQKCKLTSCENNLKEKVPPCYIGHQDFMGNTATQHRDSESTPRSVEPKHPFASKMNKKVFEYS